MLEAEPKSPVEGQTGAFDPYRPIANGRVWKCFEGSCRRPMAHRRSSAAS